MRKVPFSSYSQVYVRVISQYLTARVCEIVQDVQHQSGNAFEYGMTTVVGWERNKKMRNMICYTIA